MLGRVTAALPKRGRADLAGQTVYFSAPEHPHYDAMVKLLPDFTRETGIKVELARETLTRIKQRQLVELAKPQSGFDLVSYVVTWKSEYVKKGLIQPLAPLFANPRLADPRYDMADLVPSYLQNIG
ncbi:MAG: sugar ABC transporter substrate-binding protein, partial [Rhodoferax sp.]